MNNTQEDVIQVQQTVQYQTLEQWKLALKTIKTEDVMKNYRLQLVLLDYSNCFYEKKSKQFKDVVQRVHIISNEMKERKLLSVN